MKQKGLAPILIVLLIGIGALVLFTPIPYYVSEDVICIYGTCDKKGWYLNGNLWSFITHLPKIKEESIVIPTTTDETADWKIYTGTGWTIQYPTNWYIIEGAVGVGLSDGKDVPRGPEVGSIYLKIAADSTSSYDEVLNKPVGNVAKGTKLTITTKEKLTIDGYPAVKQIEETTPGAATEPSYTVAVYIKGPTNIRISALALTGKDNFNKNSFSTFDQILSTFKFTN